MPIEPAGSNPEECGGFPGGQQSIVLVAPLFVLHILFMRSENSREKGSLDERTLGE